MCTFPQHQRSQSERNEAAQTLADVGINGRLLVDSMDDLSVYLYCALPERLIVVERGKVKYLGGLGPRDYRLDEVDEFLMKVSQ